MHTEFFKMDHLKKIDPMVNDKVFNIISSTVEIADSMGSLIAFSLINGENVVAIGGIYELWPGVGEAFAIMSKSVTKYPKSLYSSFKSNIDAGMKIGNFIRVQATVKADFPAGIRFLEHLGFKEEGLMKKWGFDHCDYYRYARVK